MGVWSTGLYAGDFALDLRSTVASVLRLPFEPDRLVDLLCEQEPDAADRPDDEDHSTFWLVVADQFAKRGMLAMRPRTMALEIIDNGTDLAMHQKRGMGEKDLAKRSKVLQEIRTRIVTAQPALKPRAVLKQPQLLIMEIGDVLAFPTDKGKPINPYITPDKRPGSGPLAWSGDGWAAFVVIDCGRAFDFFAWYLPVTIAAALVQKPVVATLESLPLWIVRSAGTCSPVHFKRLRLEHIGKFAIDRAKLKALFPGIRRGDSSAISDISIANRLDVQPAILPYLLGKPGDPARTGKLTTFSDIRQILK